MAAGEENSNEIQGIDINVFAGGMHQDADPLLQPQGTWRYALNTIKEYPEPTVVGLGNEESNVKLNTDLGPNAVLLGKCYISDENIALFWVEYNTNPDGQINKIGIFDTVREEVKIIVDDGLSPEHWQLNFNEHHQIQATFRLRRGCERILYWVDGLNPPRQFNLDKDYLYKRDYQGAPQFKNTLFNLVKSYSKVPEFERLDINGKRVFGLDITHNGVLLPGSYNVSVRLLDADFNATEWITTTETVIIFNENPPASQWWEVRGSTTLETDYQRFGPTSKAIKVSLKPDSIDTDYYFIQYCLICANIGTGRVNKCLVSPPMPIEQNIANQPQYYEYVFTGNTEYGEIPVEEIAFDNNIIESAKTIAQIDNRLLLGNVKGKQVDWCKLQKYASRIRTCNEIKTIELDSLENLDNPASPLHNLGSVGYMPGEIYSFGIVYVFDDGTTSPVYHIPGTNGDSVWDTWSPVNNGQLDPNIDSNLAYVNESGNKLREFIGEETGTGVRTPKYGQDAIYIETQSNESDFMKYYNNEPCNRGEDFWGVDASEKALKGTPIRHHRITRRGLGSDRENWKRKMVEEEPGFDFTTPELSDNKLRPGRTLKPNEDISDKCQESKEWKDYTLLLRSRRGGGAGIKKVSRKFKQMFNEFIINIFLDFTEEGGSLYSYNHNGNYFKLTQEVLVSDWEASGKDKYFKHDGKPGWYKIDLGKFPSQPQIIVISEDVRMFLNSSGNWGDRYAFATSIGWQKVKYGLCKVEGCGGDPGDSFEWINDSRDDWNKTGNGEGCRGKDKNSCFDFYKCFCQHPFENEENLQNFFFTNNSHTTHLLHSYQGTCCAENGPRKNPPLHHIKSKETDFLYFNMNFIYINDGDEFFNASVVNSVVDSTVNQDEIQVILPTLDINPTCPNKKYKIRTFGFFFDNIQKPLPADVNYNEVIGYYIVRNERDEENKTILDSAVMFPVYDENHKFFTYGLSKRVNATKAFVSPFIKAFVNPEFKYLSRKYKGFDFLVEDRIQLYMGQYESYEPYKSYNYDGVASPGGQSRMRYFGGVISNYKYPGKVSTIGAKETMWITEDVAPGTSYDKQLDKKSEQDSDGFELQHAVRECPVILQDGTGKNWMNLNFPIEIDQVYYLAPLDDCRVDLFEGTDGTQLNSSIGNNASKYGQVYNISCDNAIGIVNKYSVYRDKNGKTLGDKYGFHSLWDNEWKYTDNEEVTTNLQYALMIRNTASPYGLFRQLPYYKETKNMMKFEGVQTTDDTIVYNPTDDIKNATHENGDPIQIGDKIPYWSCPVFNGDVYITPMKYVNSLYYNTKIRKRKRKNHLWRVIGGFVNGAGAIAGGVLLTIYAGGAGAKQCFAVGAASISFAINGIKLMNITKIQNRLYNSGLRNTIDDIWTKTFFYEPEVEDDQIQWIHEVINSLWFESTINQFWRIGITDRNFGSDFLQPVEHYSSTKYNEYFLNKLTTIETEASDMRMYQGFTKAEFYQYNLDYLRRNREKIFYHLPLEYDCCSKCKEIFNHRVLYSEQSFQEEQTDNYRKFLPNNYRDIQGETGVITNLFVFKQKLYIHTEEALYVMPRNYQERIIGDIVSFVGTGEFFSMPPIKIMDDERGVSCGSKHQWATVVADSTVLFVDERSRKIYRLGEGNAYKGESGLVPISDMGMQKFFEKNIPIQQNIVYKRKFDTEYPYQDNPSSRSGNGYITAFDKPNNRILISKVDKVLPYDFETFFCKGKWYKVPKDTDPYIQTKIQELNTSNNQTGDDGDWEYIGLDNENCQLKFARKNNRNTSITKSTWIPEVPGSNVVKNVFIDFLYYNSIEHKFYTKEELTEIGIVFNPTYTIGYKVGSDSFSSMVDLSPDAIYVLLTNTSFKDYETVRLTDIGDIVKGVFGETDTTVTVTSELRETSDECRFEEYIEVVVNFTHFPEYTRFCKKWFKYVEPVIEEPEEGEEEDNEEIVSEYEELSAIEYAEYADRFKILLKIYKNNIIQKEVYLPDEDNNWCTTISGKWGEEYNLVEVIQETTDNGLTWSIVDVESLYDSTHTYNNENDTWYMENRESNMTIFVHKHVKGFIPPISAADRDGVQAKVLANPSVIINGSVYPLTFFGISNGVDTISVVFEGIVVPKSLISKGITSVIENIFESDYNVEFVSFGYDSNYKVLSIMNNLIQEDMCVIFVNKMWEAFSVGERSCYSKKPGEKSIKYIDINNIERTVLLSDIEIGGDLTLDGAEIPCSQFPKEFTGGSSQNPTFTEDILLDSLTLNEDYSMTFFDASHETYGTFYKDKLGGSTVNNVFNIINKRLKTLPGFETFYYVVLYMEPSNFPADYDLADVKNIVKSYLSPNPSFSYKCSGVTIDNDDITIADKNISISEGGDWITVSIFLLQQNICQYTNNTTLNIFIPAFNTYFDLDKVDVTSDACNFRKEEIVYFSKVGIIPEQT